MEKRERFSKLRFFMKIFFLKLYLAKLNFKLSIFKPKIERIKITIEVLNKKENILKFERLEEDFEKLKTRYQMPDLKLTHHRKSPGKLDVSDYTPESIDIINNIYSSDFTKFNYPRIS